jgi:hypothetical protein
MGRDSTPNQPQKAQKAQKVILCLLCLLWLKDSAFVPFRRLCYFEDAF